MYIPDENAKSGNSAPRHLTQTDEETEYITFFELVMPVPRQYSAVNSTVPGQGPARFQASNTVRLAGWCITATLAAPPAVCVCRS